MLSKGVFTISIDHEFAWGYADTTLTAKEKDLIRSEAVIVRRLLQLFSKYRIRVTWAVVGHLLERTCPWEQDVSHPEYDRPVHRDDRRDWFEGHPQQGTYGDVLWFDSEGLVEEIARQGHEIGSHSYAHIHYGLPGTREASVRTDLMNMRRVHEAHGHPARSFIFPRNYEGCHRLLREYGIEVYRGVTPRWYRVLPQPLRRLSHFVSYLHPSAPVVTPTRTAEGLINVPDSMLLFSRGGVRKLIPARLIARKGLAGIQRAVEQHKVFHLWFHPSNFWHDTDTQFRVLESLLQRASQLRAAGKLEVMTMGQFVVAKRG